MPANRSVRRGSSRPANTSAADSASSLRATKASASKDSASRWWASSTVQMSGAESVAAATRASTPMPTRKRSGGGPGSVPDATRSACWWNSESDATCLRRGSMSRWRAAYGIVDSAS